MKNTIKVVLGVITVGAIGFIGYQLLRHKGVNPPKSTIIGIIRTDGQLWYAMILDDGRWHQITDWRAIGMDGAPDPNSIPKFNITDLNNSKIYQGYTIVC